VELTQTVIAPSGRLRVSMPLVAELLMPVIADFMETHPAIVLDLDFSNRLVDVIEEASTWSSGPASLRQRVDAAQSGRFSGNSLLPAYLERRGLPIVPADLTGHACLRQRSPVSGSCMTGR